MFIQIMLDELFSGREFAGFDRIIALVAKEAPIVYNGSGLYYHIPPVIRQELELNAGRGSGASVRKIWKTASGIWTASAGNARVFPLSPICFTMASVCSPDSRPVEGSPVKPGFYSVLEKLPLEYIGPSERFFLWLEFAFSAMSGTPLNSSVTEK